MNYSVVSPWSPWATTAGIVGGYVTQVCPLPSLSFIFW